MEVEVSRADDDVVLLTVQMPHKQALVYAETNDT